MNCESIIVVFVRPNDIYFQLPFFVINGTKSLINYQNNTAFSLLSFFFFAQTRNFVRRSLSFFKTSSNLCFSFRSQKPHSEPNQSAKNTKPLVKSLLNLLVNVFRLTCEVEFFGESEDVREDRSSSEALAAREHLGRRCLALSGLFFSVHLH